MVVARFLDSSSADSDLEKRIEYEKAKNNVFDYVLSATHLLSPYKIKTEHIKHLKPDREISASDDSHNRLTYIALKGQCPIPGSKYTIEAVFVNKERAEGVIKLREMPGYWGLGWFDYLEIKEFQLFH